ncbi:MAG: serine/threonine protein kinase, partial [Verrucomicrobiae bacterium]|nr:serine/threonine protein kinase [Verrucomicrobiae bacterium]
PLGRQVAVKRLKPSIALDSKFAERFEREAHFLATLQHENILHIYDFIHDGKSMSIVMEYVEGIDLYDLLERTPVLPPEVAAIIALQVARALDYAHFRGVIHRDIKPANIIIARQGVVKLMDFGIARTDELSDLTETGTGLGTPSYMSPEQILGNKLDFRTDIFSLGIVLYQMVTGRKPFVEDTERTVMQRIRLDDYTAARRINAAVPVK